MPKKKAGKKGAKIIDGVATSDMSREQLLGHVKRVQQELEREREERNFFMLEREKLFALWNLAMEQLAKEKNTARLTEIKMCENEKDREVDMQEQKQRLRYLLTEQSRSVSKVRLNNLQRMKHIQDDMWAVQDSIRESLQGKNQELSQCQIALQKILHDLQLEKKTMESKLRLECSETIRRMETKFQRLLFEREKEEMVDHRAQSLRMDNQRSDDVRQLIEIHHEEITRLKTFFNEVTTNNHAVISALQQELVMIKGSDETTKEQLTKARQEIKKLHEKMTQEVKKRETEQKELKNKASSMHKHWARMENLVKKNEERRRRTELANEALLQKLQLAQEERDLLKKVFSRAIVDMQQKSSMNKFVLEMKLASLAANEERNQSLTSSPLSSKNDDGDHDQSRLDEINEQHTTVSNEDFSTGGVASRTQPTDSKQKGSDV